MSGRCLKLRGGPWPEWDRFVGYKPARVLESPYGCQKYSAAQNTEPRALLNIANAMKFHGHAKRLSLERDHDQPIWRRMGAKGATSQGPNSGGILNCRERPLFSRAPRNTGQLPGLAAFEGDCTLWSCCTRYWLPAGEPTMDQRWCFCGAESRTQSLGPFRKAACSCLSKWTYRGAFSRPYRRRDASVFHVEMS